MQIKTLVLLFVLTPSPLMADYKGRMLFSFDQAEAAKSWQTVNDGVMGGRSMGRFRINSDQKLEFFGTLSLENNGGFASVRASRTKFALDSDDAIIARVRGDGRQYNFNLYTQRNLRGYSYRQSFKTTKDKWMEIRLPVDKFVATWRGRVFPNQQLDPSNVAGLGILLGDKQAGPFKLEIDWIKVGKSRRSPNQQEE